MNSIVERIHLADAARYVGWNVLLRNRQGGDDSFPITGVCPLGSRVLLALGSKTVHLHASDPVGISNSRQKQEQIDNASRIGSFTKSERQVHASCLTPFKGAFASVETGGSRGPHLILAVAGSDDGVGLTVSHDELIADFDYVVRVTRN